ncbi:MAG: hypothetical protein AAF666_18955, partial [Pseudomonadota bacterium]
MTLRLGNAAADLAPTKARPSCSTLRNRASTRARNLCLEPETQAFEHAAYPMSLLDRVVSPEIRVLYRRLLWDGARMHWRGYAVAIGLLLVVSVATAAMAWVMKDVINELFVDRRADMIRWIALGVIAIFLVRGLATYGNAVILS